MGIKATEWIWHNGKLVPWQDAKVHVLTHALHYGSSVFEGIRVYATPDGSRVFRLDAHTRRLQDSAKIHRIQIPWNRDQINAACKEVVARNGLQSAYVRPIAFRGYGEVGVVPPPGHPVELAIAAWEWGTYLGAEALEKGVDVCVSSWQRVAPNTIPAMAKAGGNYLSSTLVGAEARDRGFAEGIALAADGNVSEGAGENLFIVRDQILITPPASASALQGITRDSVMVLAREMGIEVREQVLPREFLYIADEVFLTGTAAEITPVRSVDRLSIGAGARGPVTKALQDAFFGLFRGETVDKWGWLEPLEPVVGSRVATARS